MLTQRFEAAVASERYAGVTFWLTLGALFSGMDLCLILTHYGRAAALVIDVQFAIMGGLTVYNLAVLARRRAKSVVRLADSFIEERSKKEKTVALSLPAHLRAMNDEDGDGAKVYSRAIFLAVHAVAITPGFRLDEILARLAHEHSLVLLAADQNTFILLANYHETENWPLNLITFSEELARQAHGSAQLSFGASSGPARVHSGRHGWSVETEESTLSSLLATRASVNEMIVTSKIWHALSDSLEGWKPSAHGHKVEGLMERLPCVHLPLRLSHPGLSCSECGGDVVVQQTAEGYIRTVCLHGHAERDETKWTRAPLSRAN